MKDFKGKTAVITGAASGVGLALAERLGREGARIVLADIEIGALDAAVARVKSGGVDAIGVKTDVTKADQVEALAEKSFSHYGEVDMVFNNAGVGGGGAMTIWDTDVSAFKWAFDVNFYGVLNGINAFAPRLLKQNKEAVLAATSSGAGLIFPPNSPAYSASKAAVIALMEILSFQLMMSGSPVKAACLFPGPYVVDTNLFNSQRNAPAEFKSNAQLGGGITSMESFQQVMEQMIGRRVETTQPSEFADYVFGALQRDEFWIMPMHDRTEKALRDRFEGMITKTNPMIADML
jgi:NAD(P)-dependent dehydrogenase (short-subunit alcohol dehydrogenase family)